MRVRTVVFLILLVALLGGGAYWYADTRAATSGGYRTAGVMRGDLLSTIAATGTLQPEEVVDVGAQVAGQILAFGKDANGKPIDYGSPVEPGMVLARIDDSVYQTDIASSKAQLQQAEASVLRAKADVGNAQAKLTQAERDWDRAQKIQQTDALAQSQYDAYRSAYEQAKAGVSVAEASLAQAAATVPQAQASLQRATRNLGYTTIASPVKGIIIDRRVNIGQTVVASLNAPSLFLIAKDLTRMQVWASVNEADIGSIKQGLPVTFTVDAFPGQVFKGSVGKVRLNAQMTQNVVTYIVEIVTDNSDGKLLPYLTANVTFEVNRKDDVLLVPNAALRWSPIGAGEDPEASATRPAGSATRPSRAGRGGGASGERRGTVYVLDGNTPRAVRLMLGMTDGTSTEVVSGDLAEGAQVIVGEQRADAGGDETRNPFMPQFPRRSSSGSGGSSGGGGSRGGR